MQDYEDVKPGERLLNLLLFLASRPKDSFVTRNDILHNVPGYEHYDTGSRKDADAFSRTFENDKKKLRMQGLVIETGPDSCGYRIDTGRTFMSSLDFTPEELAKLWVVSAAVLAGGEFPFAHDLRLALAKIAGDLGWPSVAYRGLDAVPPEESQQCSSVGARAAAMADSGTFPRQSTAESAAPKTFSQHAVSTSDPHAAKSSQARCLVADMATGRGGANDAKSPQDAGTSALKAVNMLREALVNRKKVEIDYASAGGIATTRTIRPYGDFLFNGAWYSVAYDEDHGQIRTFKVERIGRLKVNLKSPSRPDYQIPEDFEVEDYRMLPFQYGGQAVEGEFLIRSEVEAFLVPRLAGKGKLSRTDDGELLWSVAVSDFWSAASWCVEQGPGIVPLSPGELTQSYRGLLRASCDIDNPPRGQAGASSAGEVTRVSPELTCSPVPNDQREGTRATT